MKTKFKPHKQPVHDQPAPAETENEDADPVGKIPGAAELEEAAERIKRPAEADSARCADSVQQEAEITEAAMPTPVGVKQPNF